MNQPHSHLLTRVGTAGRLRRRPITLDDLTEAAQHLATSDKGRDALRRVRDWMRASGLSLDMQNKEAVFTLLDGAWGAYAGSALDAIDEALDE